MPTSHEATARWEGDLATGKGNVTTKSGVLKSAGSSWKERTEGTGSEGLTSPEELLAAAHASCFSMAFAARLAKAGATVRSLEITARVTFGSAPSGGNGVLESALRVKADAPGIDAAKIKELAEDAKANCPISKAIANNVAVTLEVLG
ncbi:MAG: OsmC family peroxiredoxin [Chloroflexi bacterium]|nr:OsmC family peroxiredoxin [Chloroflexota bacterium]